MLCVTVLYVPGNALELMLVRFFVGHDHISSEGGVQILIDMTAENVPQKTPQDACKITFAGEGSGLFQQIYRSDGNMHIVVSDVGFGCCVVSLYCGYRCFCK